MEYLIRLSGIVSKQKVKNIEVIGNPNGSSTKLNRLYEGIVNGEYKNDREAAAELYDSESSNPSYKKLKYRLEERLLNSLIFIDVNKPNYNDLQKVYFSGHKTLAVINILKAKSEHSIAVKLSEKLLPKMIKYQMVDSICILSSYLIAIYGSMFSDRKKLKHYSEVNKHYLEIYNAESIVMRYYAELAYYNTEGATLPADFEEMADGYCNELRRYLETVDSFRFLQFSYTVFWLRHQLVNDFKKGLEVCKNLVAIKKDRPNIPTYLLFLFYSKMIDCYISFNQFDLGQTIFNKALPLTDKGGHNWFNLYRKFTLLSFKTQQYQNGYELLLTVKSDNNYKKLRGQMKEAWKIIEAYLNFLIKVGKIEVEDKSIINMKFRVSKFINDVPTYSKDKRRINVPIIIIQVLFLLQQKEHGKMIDKVESLRAYCYRYLKKDNTFRSNCFIKMLLVIPKSNFNRIAVERKSEKLFDRLKSVPIETVNQGLDVEIIPYEFLWEIVLGMLGKKIYNIKSQREL